MPTLKHTISDDEHAAYKRAAALAFMPVSVWMRSNLGRLAQEAAPKADEKPALGKVAERELPRYLMVMNNLAGLNRTVAEHLAKNRAMPERTASDLAFLKRFEAWARAQGHLQGE